MTSISTLLKGMSLESAVSTIKSVEHNELCKETERAIVSNLEEQMHRAREVRNDIALNY